MDKRVLSAIPRQTATNAMIDIADRIGGIKHVITAELIESGSILVIYAYRVNDLVKGKREAEFRTFLSKDDYITQKLDTDKVRWLTASFYNIPGFDFFESHWNYKTHQYDRTELLYIRSKKEKKTIRDFFKEYARKDDRYIPWSAVYRFQEQVMGERLKKRYQKETDPIDRLMDTVGEVPDDFKEWIWEEAMSFSQYLVYSPITDKTARCECTYCKHQITVSRDAVRLRNNEKGVCPKCGRNVTIKARGRMPARIYDERWVAYIDPRENGFIWRYFHASRTIERSAPMKAKEYICERGRGFYSFIKGKSQLDSYEYAEYRQSGKMRWCHDQGKVPCGPCVLYPGNLPQAWENTPLRYSALEILSRNQPTKALHYEWGIERFMEFPALEWFIKMGLNKIAGRIIDDGIYRNYSGRMNFKGRTIYEILKLNKVNTRILQEIDGNEDELRLLQAAERIGLQFKPEQLREYYETFDCNTELLEKTKRKASLHKIVKYITKESENYTVGDRGGCWMRSYNRQTEREDPRIERKQNLARDWIEYLKWCKELKYDLDNMFTYMPKNFKKVHDRMAAEYQILQDKKKAAEKKRLEAKIKREMQKTKEALADILSESKGAEDAFSIKGKGLVIVVPKDSQDIKAEGEALHHCVGTYVERVAKGETAIFFIRKQAAPEKPYYTMEWKNNQVWQCRGLHNKAMTPEVKAFTQAFEQKMQEAADKKKKRKAVSA